MKITVKQLKRLVCESLDDARDDQSSVDMGVDLTRATYDMKQAMAAAVREYAGDPVASTQYGMMVESVIEDFDAELEALIERTLERATS